MGAIQQPYGKVLDLQTPYSNQNGNASTIRNYISIAKLTGATPTEVAVDTGYQAAFNSNPSRVFYWNLMVGAQSGAESNTMLAEIEMVQYAVLHERLSLTST